MVTSAKTGGIHNQITDWTTGVTYSLYQLVYYSSKLYRCTTAHTSTTFPADIANWLELNGSNYTSMDLAMVIALG